MDGYLFCDFLDQSDILFNMHLVSFSLFPSVSLSRPRPSLFNPVSHAIILLSGLSFFFFFFVSLPSPSPVDHLSFFSSRLSSTFDTLLHTPHRVRFSEPLFLSLRLLRSDCLIV